MSARQLARIHLILSGVWALLLIPTVIWWKDSILWVAGCSLYANCVAHLAAYDAARAEDS